jgi:ADP-heptose:LPS heptosyltransferase
MIEPHIKPGAPRNKDWGFERWQRVVNLRPDIPWLQTGPANIRPLEGVRFVPCPSVRHACAVMAHSLAYVGPEGGMHHAAAALSKPAVVVFGGYVSPAITGYDTHRNLFTGGEPCGYRIPCKHCAEAMAKITPAMVVKELEATLEQIQPAPDADRAA